MVVLTFCFISEIQFVKTPTTPKSRLTPLFFIIQDQDKGEKYYFYFTLLMGDNCEKDKAVYDAS